MTNSRYSTPDKGQPPRRSPSWLPILVRLLTMLVSEFDYGLPASQIAQYPLAQRDRSRLLLLGRRAGAVDDRSFLNLPDLFKGDELLVLNNARVIPARLFGRRRGLHAQRPSRSSVKEHLTGEVEVFMTRRVGDSEWQALVRPGRKLPIGERIVFGRGELEAEIISRGELGLRTVRFISNDGQPFESHLERLGHTPLPPYIDREDEATDRERYQTVFASRPGAVAAPTAGLHFTPEILERLRERGVELCELTLHVGLGTFQPVHGETIEGHAIHAENYEIPPETAQKIEAARASRRPVVAIGTTVVRALEDAALRAQNAAEARLLVPGVAEASVFIYPGFSFRIVDGLLTNFHLPRSTLLALVCAFAGKENALNAYRHAVQAGYRFYSYGDCMLIR
jgi:S-adenosylmethionine:tRNA ribosyltransferase-isomerase